MREKEMHRIIAVLAEGSSNEVMKRNFSPTYNLRLLGGMKVVLSTKAGFAGWSSKSSVATADLLTPYHILESAAFSRVDCVAIDLWIVALSREDATRDYFLK